MRVIKISTQSPFLKFVDSFVVTGLSTRTQNSDEFNAKTAKLPSLWERFHCSGLVTPGATIYGVYSDYESDANGTYTLTAGVICATKQVAFNSVNVLGGNYLVFEGSGFMPLAVIEIWKRIWAFFAVDNPYQRSYNNDFEEYRGSEVAIYIGVSNS